MESFVDDLKTVIRKLKIEKPPILCSFSMGGYIALRALERIEKAFSAVILCDTVSYADTNEVKLKRANAIKNINRKGLSSFVRTFIINCYTSSYIEKNKEFVDKSIENSLKFSSIGIKGCLLAIMTRSDTTEYLKSIQIPTLLLCGEYDTLTSASSMLTMARQIKGSEFVIIKNAAHMSIIENPVACNNAIKEFLSKIEEKV